MENDVQKSNIFCTQQVRQLIQAQKPYTHLSVGLHLWFFFLLKSICTYNIQELLVPHVRCVPSISNSLICIGTHWAHVCHVHSCAALPPFASNPLSDWRFKPFNYIPMRFPKCQMFHTQLQRNERKPKVISIHNHFKNCSHLFELNENAEKRKQVTCTFIVLLISWCVSCNCN